MFDSYTINKVDNSKQAAAIRELSATMADNTDKEIKARNRVDISLEEYEEMKQRIDKLERETDAYYRYFKKFHIPIDKIDIYEDTIEVWTEVNPIPYEYTCRLRFKYWPKEKGFLF